MKIAVELEFPATEAAIAIRTLQSLPDNFVIRVQGQTITKTTPIYRIHLPALSEAEQRAILAELAAPLLPGEETAEEMIARIYGDRRDAPREVEL